jgi:hypothetical protein
LCQVGDGGAPMVRGGRTKSVCEKGGERGGEENGLVGLGDVAAVVGMSRKALRLFTVGAEVGIVEGTGWQGQITSRFVGSKMKIKG